MKLCINCKHGRHMAPDLPSAAEMVRCFHPENHREVTSYVTGNLVDVFVGSQWCQDERTAGGGCGTEAARFEPK